MLSLKPEDEKILHHDALEWFNLLRGQIESEVPLEEISNDDLNMFLTDDEKPEFKNLMEEIGKGLSTCINKDVASSNTNIWDEIALNLNALQAGVNLFLPMNNLKRLLKKVYERKVAKAREEERAEWREQQRRYKEAQIRLGLEEADDKK